jgi:hypothetical protein
MKKAKNQRWKKKSAGKVNKGVQRKQKGETGKERNETGERRNGRKNESGGNVAEIVDVSMNENQVCGFSFVYCRIFV